MPKQENTAINDLIGLASRRPIDDVDEPALFGTAPPAARLRPVPFGGHLSPIGATIAPLPRRRTPAATPPQVPIDYSEDDETTVSPPPGWASPVPVAHVADTGPFAPASLPHPPYMPPQAGYSYPQQARPAYPPPHQPPAYYQAPYADHHDTMRVRALPLEPEASLGQEILTWIARLWIPFAALGVIAVSLAGYRLLRDDPAATPEPEAPIVMTAVPAEPEPVPPPIVVAEPVVAAAPVVAAEAVASDEHGVPRDSLWQPTTPQPTIAPHVEEVAAAESEPAVEIEPAADAKPASAAKPAARASKERSSSRRAAKRAAAKRAKQVAVVERPERAARETKVVAIAPAKPMKIGAATLPAAKGAGGPGKLTVASTPATLIYVDGRNTGMMTPKTLSLAEGSHKITLLSPKDRIAKTVSVEIEAGKAAKLTKDFTK